MRRRSVEDWRRAVYADPHYTDATKVLLLYLSEHMRSDGTVSIDPTKMARDLGRTERRLSERLAEAVAEFQKKRRDQLTSGQVRCRQEHRLLDRKVTGRKHTRAVYQALMPEALSPTHVCPAEGASQQDTTEQAEKWQRCPAENPVSGGAPGSQPDTRVSGLTTAEPSLPGQLRNDSSNEDHERSLVVSDVALSWWGVESPPGVPDHDTDREVLA